MDTESRLRSLSTLLSALDEEMGYQLDIDDFDDRVKLQKLVYFAIDFGFEPEYEYSIYLHGPYSPSLAEDYYHDGLQYVDTQEQFLEGMQWQEYSELFTEKTKRWLEIAATIDAIRENYAFMWEEPELKQEVVDAVVGKKETKTGYARKVYDELAENGVF